MALAKEELGRRLRQARQRAHLTQQQVADQLHIDWRQYQRWDTGAAAPRQHRIPELAKVLGVTEDYLNEPVQEHVLERIERKVDENGSMLRSLLGRVEELAARAQSERAAITASFEEVQAAQGLLREQVEFLRALGAPVPPTATDAPGRARSTESRKTRGTRRADG